MNGIGPDHYLFDLVYNPAKTVFLEKGEAAGARIKNGADMLVIQAEASWEIWNQLIRRIIYSLRLPAVPVTFFKL